MQKKDFTATTAAELLTHLSKTKRKPENPEILNKNIQILTEIATPAKQKEAQQAHILQPIQTTAPIVVLGEQSPSNSSDAEKVLPNPQEEAQEEADQREGEPNNELHRKIEAYAEQIWNDETFTYFCYNNPAENMTQADASYYADYLEQLLKPANATKEEQEMLQQRLDDWMESDENASSTFTTSYRALQALSNKPLLTQLSEEPLLDPQDFATANRYARQAYHLRSEKLLIPQNFNPEGFRLQAHWTNGIVEKHAREMIEKQSGSFFSMFSVDSHIAHLKTASSVPTSKFEALIVWFWNLVYSWALKGEEIPRFISTSFIQSVVYDAFAPKVMLAMRTPAFSYERLA